MNNATQKTNSLDGLIKWEINNVLRDVDRDGREFKFTTTTATKTNKIFCRHYKRMHTRSIIHITRTHIPTYHATRYTRSKSECVCACLCMCARSTHYTQFIHIPQLQACLKLLYTHNSLLFFLSIPLRITSQIFLFSSQGK